MSGSMSNHSKILVQTVLKTHGEHEIRETFKNWMKCCVRVFWKMKRSCMEGSQVKKCIDWGACNALLGDEIEGNL